MVGTEYYFKYIRRDARYWLHTSRNSIQHWRHSKFTIYFHVNLQKFMKRTNTYTLYNYWTQSIITECVCIVALSWGVLCIQYSVHYLRL